MICAITNMSTNSYARAQASPYLLGEAYSYLYLTLRTTVDPHRPAAPLQVAFQPLLGGILVMAY